MSEVPLYGCSSTKAPVRLVWIRGFIFQRAGCRVQASLANVPSTWYKVQGSTLSLMVQARVRIQGLVFSFSGSSPRRQPRALVGSLHLLGMGFRV